MDTAIDIELASAELDDSDLAAVENVLRSGRLSMGPQTEEFERVTAEYCGAKHAIAVSSGTAGLHLLCVAAGVETGDEVITTPFSFVASTNCFLYQGATPAFVDIEPDTYCINPELIEDAITPKTRAILAVDVFGHPADWDRIFDIAQRHNLSVIADACESLGAEYKGRKTGPMGKGGVFGYFPNKQITTGEGGMIVTNDDEVERLCRSLRNQGRGESGSWLGHVRLGYNYRMDELSAALGVSQMRRVDQLLEKRRTVASMYDGLLKDEPRVRIQQERPYARRSYFVYVMELQDEIARDTVILKLQERGIPSRAYFLPIYGQPYAREAFGDRQFNCPVTDKASQHTVALPFHNNLSMSEIRTVTSRLREVLDEVS